MSMNNVAEQQQAPTAPGFGFLAHAAEIQAIHDTCALEGEFGHRLACRGWDLAAERAARQCMARGASAADVARVTLACARAALARVNGGDDPLDRALLLLADAELAGARLGDSPTTEVGSVPPRNELANAVHSVAYCARNGHDGGLLVNVRDAVFRMPNCTADGNEALRAVQEFAEDLIAAFTELDSEPEAAE